MLGGLGLFLGTAGLAAVLLRNILERRRELALFRTWATARNSFAMTLMEKCCCWRAADRNLCALLAIAPAAVRKA